MANKANEFKTRLVNTATGVGRRQDANEYIEEAEHQEGVEYWNQFSDFDELWEDFLLFVEVVGNVW